jgi:hypothetical protein
MDTELAVSFSTLGPLNKVKLGLGLG